jgi:cytochrome c biogenesis protein CcmG/thiol:disulfide interchange protein DsbE
MQQSSASRFALLVAVIAAAIVLANLVSARLGLGSHGVLKAAADRRGTTRIELPDLNGRMWRLEDRKGKVVLINFWATWCPPCAEETPVLKRVAREFHGAGFELVGVAMDEDGPRVVRDFVARHRVEYPVLMPSRREIAASGIENLPTSYLVDRQGRTAKSYVGAVGQIELERDIRRLLSEP